MIERNNSRSADVSLQNDSHTPSCNMVSSTLYIQLSGHKMETSHYIIRYLQLGSLYDVPYVYSGYDR